MKRTTLALAVALLALTACGEEPPVTGVVTEKEYEPAVWKYRDEPVYSKRCSTTNKQRTCTRTQTGIKQVHYLKRAECYEFDLDTGWEGCVSRRAYEALNVGDKYNSHKRY